MDGLTQFVRTLGPSRIAAMGAVTLLLIGFFAFTVMRVTSPTMATLYTDMALEDSASVVKELDRLAIRYELRRDGQTILVPSGDVPRVRMRLAEIGLPKGGNVGYEIFDKTDTLGTTQFVQNLNHLRALEGELARSIRGIDRVQAARVHLVLPERPLFSRDKIEPSASIVLRLRGTLDTSQINAVRHIVASAVQGMNPQRVSIVDETGRLLANGVADPQNQLTATMDDRKAAQEQRLREQVEAIVASVVGAGKARVQVSADMDFNRVTQTQDLFDPESKVTRSTQTREEQSTSQENKTGEVTVGNELPGNQTPPGQQNPQSREQQKKTEEVVNYEISRTQRTEVMEGGRTKRLSVAVLVDGVYTKAPSGEVTYQPRPQEELDRIGALVRGAVGFDEKRGDKVEIVNLRFAETAAPGRIADEGGFSLLGLTKEDLFRIAELGVLFILGILVLLLGVRPLIRRVLDDKAPDGLKGAIAAIAAGPGATAAIAGAAAVPAQVTGQIGGGIVPALPGASGHPVAADGGPVTADGTNLRLIDQANAQGQVQNQSLQKIGDLVDRNPNESLSILRSWMAEPAR